ncbi:MAG: Hint domain-containing protein [Candidatus Dependentiae bacterium]|nr:Hint domain-containing protein [Candidatus Dependentiae bacterium]
MNKHLKSSLLLILFFFSLNLLPGFAAGTAVKIPGGYASIEQLKSGDIVYSITKSGDCFLSKVKKTTSYFLSRAVLISIGDDVIVTAPQQKFYDPEKHVWRKAKHLPKSMPLLSGHKNIVIIDEIGFLDGEIELFDIQLDYQHTFFIGTQNIVVHNFPPFFIGFSIAFGGGISFEGIYLGVCIAGWWLSTKLLKRDKGEKYNPKFSMSSSPAYAGGPDPEDDDWFERLKNNYAKKAQSKNFGNMYKDPKTNLWYSKDRGGARAHGGEHYKVFKETAKGFEFVFEVDKLGNQINKHKGPIGMFIPYSDIIFKQ